MAARRELLERIEKRIKSVWKRLWVPLSSHVDRNFETAVRSLCSQYVRLSFFIVPLSRFHYTLRGLICAHLTSTLRCHWGLWRSWLCPRCYSVVSDAFNCFTMHSFYDSTSAWWFSFSNLTGGNWVILERMNQWPLNIMLNINAERNYCDGIYCLTMFLFNSIQFNSIQFNSIQFNSSPW